MSTSEDNDVDMDSRTAQFERKPHQDHHLPTESTGINVATPMNWNGTTNTKIRTKLGVSVEKSAAIKDLPAAPNHVAAIARGEDPNNNGEQASITKPNVTEKAQTAQEKATRDALARLRALVAVASPNNAPISAQHQRETAQQELEEAEIDYNYCLYYPFNEPFFYPPTSNTRKRVAKDKLTPAKWQRVELWNLTKQCLKEGTLEQLKSGMIPVPKPNIGDLSQSTDQRKRSFVPQTYRSGTSIVRQGLDGLRVEPPSEDSEAESVTNCDKQDAMMDTDQGAATVSNPAKTSQSSATILADLSAEELDEQVWLFHLGKQRHQIDLNGPVLCCYCHKPGHMKPVCPARTCETCGAYDEHGTRFCPKTARCLCCRDRGHAEENCTNQHRRVSKEEMVCDLCERVGHPEQKCIRRFGGIELEALNIGIVGDRKYCYRCGGEGHIANEHDQWKAGQDSMSRNTGRGGKDQMSIRSQGEINIKGTARHDPINIDDDEEEPPTTFFRPKITPRAPSSRIQINTGPRSSFGNQTSQSGWNPINAPYNGQGAGTGYTGQGASASNNGYGAGASNNGYGANAPNNGYGGNGPSNGYGTNSSSNQYQQSYNTGGSNWPAVNNSPGNSNSYYNNQGYGNQGGYPQQGQYQPAPRRPAPRENVYHPMPSAGQNAWSKHRQ